MHKDSDGNWVADLDPAPGATPTPDAMPGPPLPLPTSTPAAALPSAGATLDSAVPPPPPSADPAGAGFALPSAVAPASTAPTAAPGRSRRGGLKRGLAVLGIAVVVIAIKVFLFSGAARIISVATTQTYHEPTTISGDAQSTNSSILATVNQLKDGIELPALQGGHTEGAGYTDAQGDLDYLFVLAQDNANSDSARPGVNMASLFGGLEGTELSQSTTSNFSGINLECATVTDTTGTNAPLNACDWYNNDAFGLFVDYKSSSLSATQHLETSPLTTMTK
jgi:hypothetical protein